jgi:hypothetical protein
MERLHNGRDLSKQDMQMQDSILSAIGRVAEARAQCITDDTRGHSAEYKPVVG